MLTGEPAASLIPLQQAARLLSYAPPQGTNEAALPIEKRTIEFERPTSSSPAPDRLAGDATCSRSDFKRRFAQFLDVAPDVLLPRQMSAVFMSLTPRRGV
jgi:hypothetical protein